jgi:hypothetical protein
VVSGEGTIVRIELRSPFAYLHELAAQQGKPAPQMRQGRRSKKTSQVNDLACSRLMSACAPKHTGNEPLLSLDFDDPLKFVELTAYPQRSALEPLLTID